MDTLKHILDKLNADERYSYKWDGHDSLGFTTMPAKAEQYNFVRFKKELAGKGYGGIRILVFKSKDNDYSQGVEVKVKIYVPSLCELETFFEGFVETPHDFDRLLVMLGLD